MKKALIALTLTSTLITPVQADDRIPVWLSNGERDQILKEMRGFLEASQAILEATLEEDMDRVEKVARKVGIQQARSVPPEIKSKLPGGFQKMGPKVHMGFETIADEAATMGDANVILRTLGQLQTNCISCHAVYRIALEPR